MRWGRWMGAIAALGAAAVAWRMIVRQSSRKDRSLVTKMLDRL